MRKDQRLRLRPGALVIHDLYHLSSLLFGLPLWSMIVRLFRFVILLWVQLFVLGPELLKLPVLAGHYWEHAAEDGPLSFSDFIDLHYANSDHEEADHEDHAGLPFHHHHSTPGDLASIKVWTSDPLPHVSFPDESAELQLGDLIDELELVGHPRGLLQPPRHQA